MMKKDRRWMKSVLATSRDIPLTLPWARGARRKPQALRSPTVPAATRPTANTAR